jgi:translation initiation factor IF-3
MVRLVGDDGEQIGVVATDQALAMAEGKGLDLVEVAANARPPVCRIMDYGKFKYQQAKRAQKAKRKQHVTHLKEVKLRPKIEEHDFQFKLRNAMRFLEERDKVKLTILFRGREMAHVDIGRRILERFIAEIAEYGAVEVPPKMEGRTLSLVLSPKGRPKASEAKKDSGSAPPEGGAEEKKA